jgi:mycothiol synthase
VPLPVSADQRAALPPGVELRPFRPGRDDSAWVEVNNRAFAGHAEQGNWTRDTLGRRLAEPWFDPTLLLVAEDAHGVAGFNWMRLEGDDGEIYVIGVDPRMQGSGLGRALAVAGLDAVHARGARTGSLFCAADNRPALALYRSLGFAVTRTDRAYEREVPAS